MSVVRMALTIFKKGFESILECQIRSELKEIRGLGKFRQLYQTPCCTV